MSDAAAAHPEGAPPPAWLDERWSALDGIGGEHADDATIALRLALVRADAEEVRARFVLRAEHQGAVGRAHGGALMTALDEVLGRVAWLALDRQDCLTATLTTDFRRPAPVGTALEVVGRLARREGRKLFLEGEVLDGSEIVCTAHGLWVVPRA